MQTVEEFFSASARAFSDGDIDEMARRFDLPAEAHIGHVTLPLRSYGEAAAVLRNYRESLMLEGYHHSDCKVLHVMKCGDQKAQAFVEWTSRRADDTALTQVQTSYILERDQDGAWLIKTIECLADPDSRFWRKALAA